MSWDPFEPLRVEQKSQLDAYESMLLRFNRKLNLISPDTEDHFRERHLLHCLALTCRQFPQGAHIVDWGTGGGLPAIPLAIAAPDATVYAVDSVGKKVQAVRTMARRLGLDNCFPWDGRAENWTGHVQYSVSRATAPLRDLWTWHLSAYEHDPAIEQASLGNGAEIWQPGLICLKGGDLSDEIGALSDAYPDTSVEQIALRALLKRPYFSDKYIVTVRA